MADANDRAIIRTKHLKQTAIYWGSGSVVSITGNTSNAVPIQVWCLFHEDTQIVKTVTGEEVLSKSRVDVDRLIDEGGWILKGELTDITVTDDPQDLEAKRILKVLDTVNLKNTQRIITARI